MLALPYSPFKPMIKKEDSEEGTTETMSSSNDSDVIKVTKVVNRGKFTQVLTVRNSAEWFETLDLCLVSSLNDKNVSFFRITMGKG